jgi:hypothetical protein
VPPIDRLLGFLQPGCNRDRRQVSQFYISLTFLVRYWIAVQDDVRQFVLGWESGSPLLGLHEEFNLGGVVVRSTFACQRAEPHLDPLKLAGTNRRGVPPSNDLDQLLVGATQAVLQAVLQSIDLQLDEDRFDKVGVVGEGDFRRPLRVVILLLAN